MFPSPATPTCPWCSQALPDSGSYEQCPACGHAGGVNLYAIDVFEGRSRPRLVLAVFGWCFVLLAAAVVVNALLGRGPTGDVLIFGLFLFVLLIIAGAETHGLWLMRKGTAPRRLIFTREGIELINPHKVQGVTSIDWPEVDKIDVEAATAWIGPSGGVRIMAQRKDDGGKATIRVVSASTTVEPDEVRSQIERLSVTDI